MAQILAQQISDFTGGLNLRADQFQLARNESPRMLNVEIDPRGGVFSRAGYKTKHANAIISSGQWNPKGLYNYRGNSPQIMLSTSISTDATPVDGKVYYSNGGNFSILNSAASVSVPVKSVNGAAFTSWGKKLYIAPGASVPNCYRWTDGATYATALTASGPTWQPYALPVGGYMPRAELCITHANKMFVANTYENGVAYPNRLRWSHENLPEDWFQDDYVDINAGGEGIRGLQIVDGQLLIFKPKAVYLLMGYDADSFQLVELSTTLGIEHPQQCVAGAGGVFFFDYPNGLYFYNRNGIQDLFERLRPIIIKKEINASALDEVTCSFVNNRLWLSMPYKDIDEGTAPAYATVNFVFDPTVGRNGAWIMFQSSNGYGLISGCDWNDSQDNSYHLMINPDSTFPYVYAVDNYAYTVDDVLVGATPSSTGEFESYYRTSWFDYGRYAQPKTFKKPYFVMKEVDENTEIKVEVFKNYNESQSTSGSESMIVTGTITGGRYGVDTWGNAVYGIDTVGSVIKRNTICPPGTAYSIQLEFSGPNAATSPTTIGRKWGLNSISYKFKIRRIKGN